MIKHFKKMVGFSFAKLKPLEEWRSKKSYMGSYKAKLRRHKAWGFFFIFFFFCNWQTLKVFYEIAVPRKLMESRN